jgi:hypothetical protein
MPAVSRVNKDVALSLLNSAPQSTVFLNDNPFLAATVGTVTVSGDVVITSDVTVFVEDKKIAVEGSVMASGAVIGESSPTVFAGNGK